MQSRLRCPGPTGLSLPAFSTEALLALNQHMRRRQPGGEEAGEMRRNRPVRPRPRTQLAPAGMETNRQERLQYDRQRDQTPEGRKSHRLYAQEHSRKPEELGKCKSCSNPAKPGQTRCPTCAERHRESRRRRDAKKR